LQAARKYFAAARVFRWLAAFCPGFLHLTDWRHFGAQCLSAGGLVTLEL
jgi:hypothetical protein